MKKSDSSILVLVLLLAAGSGLAQELPELVGRHGYADLIVLNGQVVTMDDRTIVPDTPGHIHRAMAIKGKRIMSLGTDEEMRSLAGPRTRTVDVEGRTVIPGFRPTITFFLRRPPATGLR